MAAKLKFLKAVAFLICPVEVKVDGAVETEIVDDPFKLTKSPPPSCCHDNTRSSFITAVACQQNNNSNIMITSSNSVSFVSRTSTGQSWEKRSTTTEENPDSDGVIKAIESTVMLFFHVCTNADVSRTPGHQKPKFYPPKIACMQEPPQTATANLRQELQW
jgi:hypothetical protein